MQSTAGRTGPNGRELTGLSGQDIGVDLVAKHHDGTWIAIADLHPGPRATHPQTQHERVVYSKHDEWWRAASPNRTGNRRQAREDDAGGRESVGISEK